MKRGKQKSKNDKTGLSLPYSLMISVSGILKKMLKPSRPLEELESLLDDDDAWEENTGITNIVNIQQSKPGKPIKTIIASVAIILAAILKIIDELHLGETP